VRSSNPYPINLNLRQLRNILKIDENMDVNCFNMVVRMLACHAIQLAKYIPRSLHAYKILCKLLYNHISLHFASYYYILCNNFKVPPCEKLLTVSSLSFH
jgi:hypothetical protein